MQGVFLGIAMLLMLFLGYCQGDRGGGVNLEEGSVLPTDFSIGQDRFMPQDPVRYFEISNGDQQPYVQFLLSDDDAKLFGDFTKSHIGKTMEMQVCGETILAPVIQEAIYGGMGMLSGPETLQAMQGYMQAGCP